MCATPVRARCHRRTLGWRRDWRVAKAPHVFDATLVAGWHAWRMENRQWELISNNARTLNKEETQIVISEDRGHRSSQSSQRLLRGYSLLQTSTHRSPAPDQSLRIVPGFLYTRSCVVWWSVVRGTKAEYLRAFAIVAATHSEDQYGNGYT